MAREGKAMLAMTILRTCSKRNPIIIIALSLISLIHFIRAGRSVGPPKSSLSGSGAVDPFVAHFEHVLLSNDILDTDREFIPLVFEDGKILCRRRHKEQLSSINVRTHFFTQMVRKGLKLQNNHTALRSSHGLPMLVMEGDGCGCNAKTRTDSYNYPRLTWSMLARNDDGNCKAIGIPSYETWKFYHRSHRVERDWERTFQKNEKQHPWSSKIDKAVWRGSTTYEGSQYHSSKLGDTPRGTLVRVGMNHTDLMDVAFHKIVQKYASQKKELGGQFTVANRISPAGMMKYKAIIDIDGNNWSSRFGMLLCSNSVVIKIDPDFLEYFYVDGGEVRPRVHYMPASLENITEVIAYALDKNNEDEMKAMIQSANDWCKRALSEEGLARGAVRQLEVYNSSLASYSNSSWIHEWQHTRERFDDALHDLVDCNARSVLDPFIFPMFAGI